MAEIAFAGQTIEGVAGESLLDSLLRAGVDVSHSCRRGTCLTCAVRITGGDIPAEAQHGLRDTLRAEGYALACQFRPSGRVEVARARDHDLYGRATIETIVPLAPRVVALQLRTATALYYHAGQFINLRRGPHLVRSYSLASVPRQDPLLEVHVRVFESGAMSGWLGGAARPGDAVDIQGPLGTCYYLPGREAAPMLLIGTGTGLAPLLGIARDALSSGHGGPVTLYHGSRQPSGLYAADRIRALAAAYPNFRYRPCLTGEDVPAGHAAGRVEAVALAENEKLRGYRIFACGHPGMVQNLRRQAYLAGAALGDILCDSFDLRDLRRRPRTDGIDPA